MSAAAAQDSPVSLAVETPPETAKNVRPGDMVKTAEGELEAMKAAPTRIRELIDDAREARDVIKVLCLSDKLDQAQVAVETATLRLASLRAAVAQSDSTRMHHESTIIGVLKARTVALASEANQCVGEDMGFIGENDLKVTIDPGIPPEDTNPFNPGMPPEDASLYPRADQVLVPPPLVSPTS